MRLRIRVVWSGIPSQLTIFKFLRTCRCITPSLVSLHELPDWSWSSLYRTHPKTPFFMFMPHWERHHWEIGVFIINKWYGWIISIKHFGCFKVRDTVFLSFKSIKIFFAVYEFGRSKTRTRYIGVLLPFSQFLLFCVSFSVSSFAPCLKI